MFSRAVCHAVMNAILSKNTPSLEGHTIYTTMFPCNKCAQLIIQSKIAEIVSLSEECETHDKAAAEAAKNLFSAIPTGGTEPRVAIR